jgi:hypothetical protein
VTVSDLTMLHLAYGHASTMNGDACEHVAAYYLTLGIKAFEKGSKQ